MGEKWEGRGYKKTKPGSLTNQGLSGLNDANIGYFSDKNQINGIKILNPGYNVAYTGYVVQAVKQFVGINPHPLK